MTPVAPDREPSPSSFVIPAAWLALLLGLSLIPPSSTRIYAWPWAGFAAAFWLLPIFVALVRLALGRPHSRFNGLIDAGFALLAVVATVSALTSPLRATILPHLLPFLGTCALPYALLPALQPTHAARTARIAALLVGAIIFTSLLLWFSSWPGLLQPASRNPHPFGHANIIGSVAVLATTWFALAAVRDTNRAARFAFIGAALLSIFTALSSGSRGAVLALSVAGIVAASIVLLQRGRRLTLAILLVAIAAGCIASNARLRDLVVHGRWSDASRESNDQRTAMLLGGLRLGAERPLLGWGAGSVPHVFPRVRADLPGSADNFLQLHNTPAQLWATLGATGLIAGALIAAGLVSRLRARPWTPDRVASLAGLAAAATVLLFDHPFATPVFAVLATAHLTAFLALPLSTQPSCHLIGDKSSVRARRFVAVFFGVLLLPTVIAATRDVIARAAYTNALDHLSLGDPENYVAGLRHAMATTPGDPYYPHLLAAHLATASANPSRREAAILLEHTLLLNPDLEYAHYNLGWLHLESNPPVAAQHFAHAARLAPQRGGVYLGLGFARIQQGDTDGALRAFATEWLLDPSSAWSPLWAHPPLNALRPRIHALAREAVLAQRRDDPWTQLDVPVQLAPPYRRLRTGYGVLMGHPDGPPPVDYNIQQKPILPESLRIRTPRFGWLPGDTLLEFLHAPAHRP